MRRNEDVQKAKGAREDDIEKALVIPIFIDLAYQFSLAQEITGSSMRYIQLRRAVGRLGRGGRELCPL